MMGDGDENNPVPRPMYRPPAQSEGDSVEIPTPLGRLTIAGRDTVRIIILVAVMGGFGWILDRHMNMSTELLDSMHAMQQSIDELKYVISLPEDERKKFHLYMPDSLRKNYQP